MADKIRGLTVAISADASQFKKGMNECRNAAKQSQSELNALQKSLELKFDSATFARAQKVAQDALDQTAKNADILRERLAYLEQSGNVDTTEYSRLQTELAQTELKAKQLQQQIEKINQTKLDAIAKGFNEVGGAISSAGQILAPFSAIAAAGGAALIAAGTSAVKAGDDIATLATQYDTTASAIQRFQYVALQTDVASEDLYKALVKVRAGIADIASGTTSTASKALQGLQLDFDSFDGSEEQFYAIIDALAGMTDKTQMVAAANDIFGDKLANNILPLIYAGTDAVNAYRAEFDELGAMTDEQVAALGEFDNVLNKIKTQLSNVGKQIGASLLPLMQSIANVIETSIVPKLQKLAEWFNSLTLGQQKFALAALAVVAALAPLTIGIGKLVSSVGNIIQAIPKLTAALDVLAAHPIILIIAAVVAVLILLYTKCEAFREAINNLVATIRQVLQPVLDLLMQTLDLVMQVLQPIIDLVGGVLAVAINVISEALQPVIAIIQAIFDILSPLLDMLMTVVDLILTPIQIAISALFGILQPLLSVALIPLKLVLQALQVPLQILGQLLGWLSPLFQVFGNVVKKIFGGVVKVINFVLGFIEDAINFVIGIINGLIDGVNGALGWLGVHIDRIAEVKLRIDTSEIDDMDDVNAIIDTTAPDTSGTGGGAYDQIGAGGTSGDVYNNDYSTNNTTQNVTVVIENYAAEIDVDEMVHKINVKLAEAM
ncbi:MAG: hypothetical protein NC548_26225 [Lachnospiraceae bacterium]|nr:hypothetical protein [Lachnospiraceae bacterium]